MRRTLPCLAMLVLAGCAADRAPPAPEMASPYCPDPPAIVVNAQGVLLVPPILAGGAVDWQTAFATQAQFGIAQPARLAGRWPETAQGLARLVMLGNAFARDFRFQTLPSFGTFSMQQGVLALRASLGIPASLADGDLASALLRTECALWRGDRVAAQAALAPVASAADALDRIAPRDNQAPRIPSATQAAASQAARAMQLQDQRRRP